jgi:hypothetical protein
MFIGCAKPLNEIKIWNIEHSTDENSAIHILTTSG